MASHVAHDINFVALSGIMSTILPKYGKSPVFPSVFLGDVSAAILCALSITMALLNKAKGFDRYQVIDMSYAEASAYLSIFPQYLTKIGVLGTAGQPGVLNGSAARYNFYQSKDAKWFALGALEMKYYIRFLEIFNLKAEEVLSSSEQDQMSIIQGLFEKRQASQIQKTVQKLLTPDRREPRPDADPGSRLREQHIPTRQESQVFDENSQRQPHFASDTYPVMQARQVHEHRRRHEDTAARPA